MTELRFTDFQKNIRINQLTGKPKATDFEKIDQLFIILPKKTTDKTEKSKSKAAKSTKVKKVSKK